MEEQSRMMQQAMEQMQRHNDTAGESACEVPSGFTCDGYSESYELTCEHVLDRQGAELQR